MLRKDDVVYYKVKLEKLFEEAKQNNIIVELKNERILFIDKNIGECAGFNLKNISV